MKKTDNKSNVIIEFLHLKKKEQDAREKLDDFRKEHATEINSYFWDEERKRILDKLPKHLEIGCMVWCRRGSVVAEVTPCKELTCPFKSDKDDVVNGCSKCQNFQLTQFANNWNEAIHIDWDSV